MTSKENNSYPQEWCLEAKTVASNLCKHVGQLWGYRLLISVHYGSAEFFFFCDVFWNFQPNELLVFFCEKAKHFLIFIFYFIEQSLDLWMDWLSLTRNISAWNSPYKSLQGLMTSKVKNSVPQALWLEAQTVASNLCKYVVQLWRYEFLISVHYWKPWFFFVWGFLQVLTK